MDKHPTIDEVRERRRRLAEEDRILAEIETALVKASSAWEEYTAQAAALVPRAPARVGAGEMAAIFPPSVPPKRKTKKQLIVEALSPPHRLWQTANEIQRQVSATEGREIPMSSVSPALSMLRKSEDIVRRDMFVALRNRVELEEPEFFKENGEAQASPETGEPEISPILSLYRDALVQG